MRWSESGTTAEELDNIRRTVASKGRLLMMVASCRVASGMGGAWNAGRSAAMVAPT